jgi:hypothetical protein
LKPVEVSFHLCDTSGDLFRAAAEVHPAELIQLRLQVVYFALTGGQLFQQGTVQRFLFGKPRMSSDEALFIARILSLFFDFVKKYTQDKAAVLKMK